MTREEALEYVNNMWMYEDTKNALETLIPEFGKAGKVIDHEDKYRKALLEARAVLEPCLKYSNGKVREALDSIDKELKSFESDDERIRKELKEAFEAYDIESSWNGIPIRSIFAWLEKQKEQKPKAKAKSPLSPHELYDAKIEGISQGRQDVLDHPEQFGLQKPAEWSEEALNVMNLVYRCIRKVLAEFAVYTENEELLESREETVCYYSQRCAEKILKSLRPQPSWKPSEEQQSGSSALKAEGTNE